MAGGPPEDQTRRAAPFSDLRLGSPLLIGCCLFGAVVSILARYPEDMERIISAVPSRVARQPKREGGPDDDDRHGRCQARGGAQLARDCPFLPKICRRGR